MQSGSSTTLVMMASTTDHHYSLSGSNQNTAVLGQPHIHWLGTTDELIINSSRGVAEWIMSSPSNKDLSTRPTQRKTPQSLGSAIHSTSRNVAQWIINNSINKDPSKQRPMNVAEIIINGPINKDLKPQASESVGSAPMTNGK